MGSFLRAATTRTRASGPLQEIKSHASFLTNNLEQLALIGAQHVSLVKKMTGKSGALWGSEHIRLAEQMQGVRA